MITTLLLDLDGTLLDSDLNEFVPAYFSLLSSFFEARLDLPDRLLPAMDSALKTMLQDQDPTRTLQTQFDNAFYPTIGLSQGEFHSLIAEFLGSEHPKLRPLTRAKTGAPSLLEDLFDAGLDIVVATNPVWPLPAIEQRLQWAGVAPNVYPFTAITSYENSHFSKPDLAYYFEILGRLGRTADEAAMVGDDLEADILPAITIGMAAFHVRETEAGDYPGGSLEEVPNWIQAQAPGEADPKAAHNPEVLLAQLRGQLAAMLGLVRNLEEGEWISRPEPEAWSPIEILSHLRDVEQEVNQPRIAAILQEDTPFLSAEDADQWAEQRAYRQQDGLSVLGQWTEARRETIRMVNPLNAVHWSRKGKHSLLGPTELREMVSVGLQHELLHLEQMRKTIQALQ